MAGDCNLDVAANDLMTALVAGKDFTLPDVDLSDPSFAFPSFGTDLTNHPAPITNDMLTTKAVGGTGTFDIIADSFLAHLKEEYDKGRITGDQYAKTYMGLMEAGISNAVQFLLQRDAAYWNVIQAQAAAQVALAQVVKARVELETAKAQLAAVRFEAMNQEASYALTKAKIATESAQYCTVEYTLANILPIQKQIATEQAEAGRAQVSDTMLDGVTPVTGLIGKQKALYQQQIVSYQRDSEYKGAKLFTDAWVAMKTIDEGLLPPANFDNVSLNNILGTIKSNLGFPAGT
jgi:hypothetical protein